MTTPDEAMLWARGKVAEDYCGDDMDGRAEVMEGKSCFNEVEALVEAYRAGHAAATSALMAEREALVGALQNAVDALEGKIPDLDQQICCSGHNCGCRGATNRCLLIHDIRAAALTKGTTNV
jgi:hypothetical protein